MNRFAALVTALALALTVACSKSPTSPATPTPTSTATKILSVSGTLAFGTIQAGSSVTATLHLTNDGNTTLTVTGLTGSTDLTGVFVASWTSGPIAPGATQDVLITFSPAAAVTYSGTLQVNGDQTGGSNTVAFLGTGTLDGVPLFSQTGTGDTVFDMPLYVATVQVVGTYAGTSANFVVWIGPTNSACGIVILSDGGCRRLVIALLGTSIGPTVYDATVLTGGGGRVQVVKSSGVAWSMTEVR
jgi:hypothetical protein